jgi:hypothetical protein
VLALNAADALPKAPKEDVVAARALLACAFAVRFDMAGLDEGKLSQGRCWIEVWAEVFVTMKRNKAGCSYVSEWIKETHSRTSVNMAKARGLREICGSA